MNLLGVVPTMGVDTSPIRRVVGWLITAGVNADTLVLEDRARKAATVLNDEKVMLLLILIIEGRLVVE